MRTREQLIARMKKAAKAIYIATDKMVADDISSMLLEAVELLEKQPAENSDAANS